MQNHIEPDFKLLMLLHEMFADGKSKPAENKSRKKEQRSAYEKRK